MGLVCYRGEKRVMSVELCVHPEPNRTGLGLLRRLLYPVSTHSDVACSLLWKKKKLGRWVVGVNVVKSMQARYRIDPPASRGTSRIGRSS